MTAKTRRRSMCPWQQHRQGESACENLIRFELCGGAVVTCRDLGVGARYGYAVDHNYVADCAGVPP